GESPVDLRDDPRVVVAADDVRLLVRQDRHTGAVSRCTGRLAGLEIGVPEIDQGEDRHDEDRQRECSLDQDGAAIAPTALHPWTTTVVLRVTTSGLPTIDPTSGVRTLKFARAVTTTVSPGAIVVPFGVPQPVYGVNVEPTFLATVTVKPGVDAS